MRVRERELFLCEYVCSKETQVLHIMAVCSSCHLLLEYVADSYEAVFLIHLVQLDQEKVS